jgi:carbamoyltransferase
MNKNNHILGFCSGHDASAFVVSADTGELVFAVEEERLNRIKKYLGKPLLSIAECEKRYGDNWTSIVHSSSYHQGQLIDIRESIGGRSYKMVDHHFTHAVSSYYHSGWNKCLAFTSDGAGPRMKQDKFSDGNTDEFSGVYICENGEVEQIASTNLNTPNFISMGMFYFWLTYRCGFRPNRHEGKLTGLAAHGDPNRFYDYFDIMYVHDDGSIRYKEGISYSDNMSHTRFHAIYDKIAEECNVKTVNSDGVLIIEDMELRKDVAAAAQAVFDDINKTWVAKMVEKYGIDKVGLAGGCFANVKTNQGINELDCVDEIFVQPAMTDAGTALGAALWEAKNIRGDWEPYYLENVLYGPEWSEQEVIEAVKQEDELQYEKVENIEKTVAQMLVDGKIIGKYDGRMEYGPRALGSRTILCHPTDKTAIDWLNKRLSRSEYMPFAPVVLEDYVDDVFVNPTSKHTSLFMTLCYDVKEEWHDKIEGVVHVDGTARPQIVPNNETHASYYKLVDEYRKLTGLPVLINTSYNAHNEPILCDPVSLMNSIKNDRVDYAWSYNILISKKDY